MSRVLVITSIVTAVAVLIYTVFAGLQWWAIRKQGDYASQQVGKMQEQLDAIREQARIMSESLAETRNIFDQNERAVGAAERSLEIAQRNTIYAERAYVSVTAGDGNWERFFLRIENSGNTPASKVQLIAVAEIRPDPLPVPDGAMPGTDHYTYVGLIAPRSFFEKDVRINPAITVEQRPLVGQNKLKPWSSGIIHYQDAFGIDRKTTFCFYQTYGSTKLQPWVQGNEAD